MSDGAQANQETADVEDLSESSPLMLSAKQELAMKGLAAGYGLGDAAEYAGVSRMTLYRWLRNHAAFRAAYNAWEQQTRESARSRLLNVAHRAVDKVISGVGIDYKFAFQVVKELGLHRPAPINEIDPHRMQREIEVEVKELDRRLVERAARLTQAAGNSHSARKITVRETRSRRDAAEAQIARIAEACYEIEDVTLPDEQNTKGQVVGEQGVPANP